MNKLLDASIFSVCESVVEALQNNESVVETDIGLGTLSILRNDNSLKFKFIPSAKLKGEVVNSIKQKENSLLLELEENLSNKILNTYKEII